jgi:hypothetical protein
MPELTLVDFIPLLMQDPSNVSYLSLLIANDTNSYGPLREELAHKGIPVYGQLVVQSSHI